VAGFDLSFKQARAGFFSMEKILKEADRLNARAQAKFGAFVRRRMKSSIKYKDGRDRKKLLKRIAAERQAAKAAQQSGDRKEASRHRAVVRALRTRLADVRNPVSKPGDPPFAHRGKSGKSPLRELIFFSRDPATNSVVIGPVAFGPKGAGKLEQGGAATVVDPVTKRKRAVSIRPRPFARPAGEAEAKNFGQILKSLVK
jgi:hypothetical protein